MLDHVEEGHLIDKEYIKTMMHRPISKIRLIINEDEEYQTKYILEPLRRLRYGKVEEKRNIVSRTITCIKDNGVVETIRIGFRMMRGRM